MVRASAADVGVDDVAEAFPGLALESLKLNPREIGAKSVGLVFTLMPGSRPPSSSPLMLARLPS